MHLTVPLSLLPALLLLAACDLTAIGDNQRYTEDFTKTFDVAPGAHLTVENFNGSVEIYSWDTNKIEVSGTKHASRQEDLGLLKVDIVASGDRVQVRTVRPSEGIRRGSMGAKYRIHVPRKTALDRVETSNGSVRVDGVQGNGRLITSNGSVKIKNHVGDVDLTTSNGPVDISAVQGTLTVATSNGPVTASDVKGHIEATTSNGPIRVDVAETQTSRPLKLKTSNGPVQLTLRTPQSGDIIANSSNGPITVRIQEGMGARVKARTSNAQVQSELPLAAVATQLKNRLEGTIGTGGPLLDLATSNGAIRISRN